MNQETRNCQNCKQAFVVEPVDFEFYEVMRVPAPTFCPLCRLQRRLAFKNERTLFKRACDLCKKQSIAIFPEGTKFPVYCASCWWSDKWDAADYGVNYDPTKNFFEQFFALRDRVPKIGLYIDAQRAINSDYVNLAGPVKNCYLVFLVEESENCMYSSSVFFSKDLVDCTKVSNVTRAYWVYDCHNSFNIFYSIECKDCVGVYFSKNLKNCQNCFGCVNLANKSYCFFNEQLSKEEYDRQLSQINLGVRDTVEEYKKRTKEFFAKFPVKYYHGANNVNVSGDYIYNSKNVLDSVEVMGGEDCRFCFVANMPTSDHCYDYGDWGNGVSYMYEAVNCGEAMNKIKFSYGSWMGMEQDYCDLTYDSSYLFGCISLKKKKYHILNKEYSKEEYEMLRSKIISDMNAMPYTDKNGYVYRYGEFFPAECSHFGYNTTAVQEYFPLSKESIISHGYRFVDRVESNISGAIKAGEISRDISDVGDGVLEKTYLCVHEGNCMHGCSGAFRITKQELAFYREFHIPIPTLCHNCRHYERLQWRNPVKLQVRMCMCGGEKSKNGLYKNEGKHMHGMSECMNTFQTTYDAGREEVVYCEDCYKEEVA